MVTPRLAPDQAGERVLPPMSGGDRGQERFRAHSASPVTTTWRARSLLVTGGMSTAARRRQPARDCCRPSDPRPGAPAQGLHDRVAGLEGGQRRRHRARAVLDDQRLALHPSCSRNTAEQDL